MTERDPDTIYLGQGPEPYCRVDSVNFGGKLGITLVPLSPFAERGQLTFSPSGAQQLISIIERKRRERL